MIYIIGGAIQNFIDLFNCRTEETAIHKPCYAYYLMYLENLCKVSAHSDSNCDIYCTSNTIGVAIAGQR